MKHSLRVSLLTALLSAAAAPTSVASASLAPALPTSAPIGGFAVETLQKVCLPVLRGSDLKASAHAAGFVMKDGQWVLTIDRDTSIVLFPPDASNPHACSASITAPFADAPTLQKAVDAWARTQTPPLVAVSVPPASGGGWTSSLWNVGGESVALGQERPAAPTASAQSNLQVTLNPT